MKSKYFFEILAIMIIIFIGGCLQEEKAINSDNEVPISTNDKEAQKWNIPDSLKLCLQKYVYGKEGNWVSLAENHCGPLLPSKCFFAYGKEAWLAGNGGYKGERGDGLSNGKFGVYCPAEFSEELNNCQKKIDYSLYEAEEDYGTDGFYIFHIYENCWGFIPDTCVLVNVVDLPYANMFYCIINS